MKVHPEKQLLVAKFPSSQLKYNGAKFAVSVRSTQHPINNITIDADGTLHGWIVTALNPKFSPALRGSREFAETMKGIMKVSIYQICSMREPRIIHLN